MRGQRGARVLVGVASVLVIVSALTGCVASAVTASLTPLKSDSSTHTLVITANGSDSVAYTVAVSGRLSLANSDQPKHHLQGSHIRAVVREDNDTKVIHYIGYIEGFQVEGPVQVSIDRRQVPPEFSGDSIFKSSVTTPIELYLRKGSYHPFLIPQTKIAVSLRFSSLTEYRCFRPVLCASRDFTKPGTVVRLALGAD